MRTLVLCIFLSGICLTLSSQQLFYRSIGVNDGLSDPVVFRIYSDHEGFLWFSTDNGLDRFDGNSTQNFNTQTGLGRNTVLPIAQDQTGTIWVGTYGGGLCYKKDERFFEYNIKASTKPQNITALLFDTNNNGWAYDNVLNSLFKFNPGNGTTEVIDLSSDTKLFDMVEINPGKILFSTASGLFITSGGNVTTYSPFNVSPAYSIDKDTKGNVFVGTNSGILRLDKGTKFMIQHPVFEGRQIKTVKVVNDSVLWAGTDGKLILFNYGNHAKKQILAEINGITVTDIERDIEGNFWIATYGQGVRCYYQMTDYFFSTEDGLPEGFISAIAGSANGRTWISTLKMNEKLAFILENKIEIVNPPDLGKEEYITSMISFQGDLLLSLSSGRFMMIDPITLQSQKQFETGISVEFSYKSKSGNIWGSRYRETIARLSESAEVELKDYYALKNTKILSLCEYNKNLLIGTDSGLYVLNLQNNKIVLNINEKNGLSGNQVNKIVTDSANNIWIGTSNGISMFNGKIITHYSTKNGLNSNNCHTLVIDNHNHLWVGTSNGLNYFDYQRNLFFDYHAGLRNKAITVLYPDDKNSLWVGTSDGLMKIPQQRQISNVLPFVYFETFSINGKEYREIQNKKFRHFENNISIRFSSRFFSDPTNSVYYYRINKGSWNTTKNRSIEFADLRPGNYFIEVKMINSFGLEGSNIASLSFTIRNPFWSTWWFILLEAVTVSGLIVFVIRRRILYIKKTEREKLATHKKVLDLEQKALSALINPHFIFNALASVQHYITVNDKDAAYNFLSKFSKLIRLTLENVYRSKNSIEEEIERLELYMSIEKLRFKDKFNYEIILDEEISAYDTEIPAMLIQPFIENSIWHGIMLKKESGKVTVRFQAVGEDYIKVRVEDDGIGLNKAKEMKKKDTQGVKKESLALKITVERLNLIAKLSGNKASVDIYDRREKGEEIDGTVVEIVIPVNYQLG